MTYRVIANVLADGHLGHSSYEVKVADVPVRVTLCAELTSLQLLLDISLDFYLCQFRIIYH